MSGRKCVRVSGRPSFRVRLGNTVKGSISVKVGFFVRVKTRVPYRSDTRLGVVLETVLGEG